MADLIAIVTAVNALARLAMTVGLTMQQLAAAQAKAEMEGREFGLEDLKELEIKARASLDALREEIVQAERDASR